MYKSIRRFLLASTVLFAASCVKENIPPPVVSQALVVEQSAEIPLPQGFENWPRTIFVFDKNTCVRKLDVANEDEMKVKLEVGSGYSVVVLVYDTMDNLSITPSQAGEPSYKYRVSAASKSDILPRLWYSAVDYDKDAEDLSLSFIPITSTLNIEFESVPDDLDSVVVDLPVSMDTWYPSEQKSEVSTPGSQPTHFVLSREDMQSKVSMGVFAMLNCNATDSALLRCQVPVSFCYKTQRKPGVIPFKGRIGEAQECNIVIEDSHEDYFDNDFNIRYNRRDMVGGGEVGGTQPLSLWPIDYDYEVALDTTSFVMNAGRSFAFQFGSISSGYHDDYTGFDWGDRSGEINMYSELGFDFYRIPIDEGWCFLSSGELKPECEVQLKKMVDWMIDSGANVIIDLHWLAINQTFPDSEQEIRYRNCWRQFHELFGEYPTDRLAYELLNEAAGLDGYWNTFIANSVAMIRSWGGKEVERKIVCACPDYQDISGMATLELPTDPNLIASFHSYAPVFFCFYRTGFGESYGFDKYDGPMHYPGYLITSDELAEMQKTDPENYNATIYFRNSYYDRETLYNEFKPAYEAKKRLNVPVWVGEYGPHVPQGTQYTTYNDRLHLYQDVCSIFRQFGFSHSYWFDLDGVYHTGIPDQAEVDAILGRDGSK